MKKKQEGYCHICGKYGELSFEHIPPETALNQNRAIVYTGNDVIKRYKGEKNDISINNKEWENTLYAQTVIA